MPIWKMLVIGALIVIVWELLRLSLRQLLAVVYFKRESDEVVIRVKVMMWDTAGRKHFEEQGYSRKYPGENSEKANS